MFNPITNLPDNCVVLDTETTGFEPTEGHRMVEFGAIKMIDGLPTKESLHLYINPNRTVPQASVDVHGLTQEFLKGHPLFHEQAQKIVDFIGDLPLVAHNAKFDAKFLNFELDRAGAKTYEASRWHDSVAVARKLFPGSPANLDALCRRFNISLNSREKHGALIDTELLAEVLVEMGGGRQQSLIDLFSPEQNTKANQSNNTPDAQTQRITVVPSRLDADTIARHKAFIAEKMGESAIWNTYMEQEA